MAHIDEIFVLATLKDFRVQPVEVWCEINKSTLPISMVNNWGLENLRGTFSSRTEAIQAYEDFINNNNFNSIPEDLRSLIIIEKLFALPHK